MDYIIKDEAWAIIFPILNEIKGLHTGAHENLRNFMEGVGYILRSGGSVAFASRELWSFVEDLSAL